jgi:riboflavin biosynthesis pyrimidine reductase
VSDDDAGTRFTLLGSGTAVDLDQLASLYAYPGELNRCWVRADMIASLDGAATMAGRTGGLAGAGDRAVFKAMREVADVILVGAATVRMENYGGVTLSVAARQRRQGDGQPEVPPIAVVTGTGALESESRLFTQTEVAPLIFTSTASAQATRDRLAGVATVIDASSSDPIAVDPQVVLAELARRGLRRVLCEGGPTLLGGLVECGLLDELALTIAPTLVAGGARRIVTGQAAVTTGMRVAHVLTDEQGYLYTRYTRGG